MYLRYNHKKEGETLIYWQSCTAGDNLLAAVNGFGFDVAPCAPPDHAFDKVFACAAPVQSATLRLLTLCIWSAGSTPRLIVALPFACAEVGFGAR